MCVCVWRGEAERWRWGRLRKRTRKKKECWGIREWCFPVSFHFSKSLISSEGKRAIGQVVTVGEHTQTFSYQPRLLEIELVYHSHCLHDSPGDGLDRVRGSQTFCPGSCLWLRFSNTSTLVTVWKSSRVWLNASRKILSAVHAKNDNYNCKYTVFLTQVGGVHTANVTSTVGNDIAGVTFRANRPDGAVTKIDFWDIFWQNYVAGVLMIFVSSYSVNLFMQDAL